MSAGDLVRYMKEKKPDTSGEKMGRNCIFSSWLMGKKSALSPTRMKRTTIKESCFRLWEKGGVLTK